MVFLILRREFSVLADPAGSDDTPVRMDGEEPPAEDTTITNGNSEW